MGEAVSQRFHEPLAGSVRLPGRGERLENDRKGLITFSEVHRPDGDRLTVVLIHHISGGSSKDVSSHQPGGKPRVPMLTPEVSLGPLGSVLTVRLENALEFFFQGGHDVVVEVVVPVLHIGGD